MFKGGVRRVDLGIKVGSSPDLGDIALAALCPTLCCPKAHWMKAAVQVSSLLLPSWDMPQLPLPLIHLSSSSGSQSKVRWAGMGREHLTPFPKADPWENQTRGGERSVPLASQSCPISLPGSAQDL